ncbi:phosphoribosyltransferase family protein [Burkholderia sp. BCC0397]|uniref:phosphoribosylanthranilate isomerase n=1 Tax=Burkholderia sp. BCC0397 TaxID=486876 RepID=UPI00158C9DD7|nr:phosphoribosyltransferase family protein [Burkholderia sp. BCC0397]
MKTRIKICGLTNLDDALAAVHAGADALGFVFSESPRRMAARDVRAIVDRLPPFVSTVGVFVDEPLERLRDAVDISGVALVQLQGRESTAYCRQIGRPVIKGFRIDEQFDPAIVDTYDVGAYLFDAAVDGRDGGTGVRFDWERLRGIRFSRPVIVAGGLDAGNVRRMLDLLGPAGVDVSSGVGASATRKDPKKLREFVAAVRQAHGVADGVSGDADMLRASFDDRQLVGINGKQFLVNSLTEQVPATPAHLLRVAAQRVCDAIVSKPGLKLVGEEDKGGALLAAVSLLSGLPFGIARWYPSGLEGQVKVGFGCEYTSGELYLNGVEDGDRVVIVDDMISTGGTLIGLVEAVRQAGATVEQIVCVVEKADYAGVERVREATGLDVRTLVRVSVAGDRSRVLDVNY